MSNLPGDEIPEEALPEGGSTIPAQDADLAPVWCRHDVKWFYDGDRGGYVCEDDGHNEHDEDGEQIPVNTACAIEDGTVYTFPPSTNPTIWAVLQAQEAALAEEARLARLNRMLK